MESSSQTGIPEPVAQALATIEQRLGRIEQHLGLQTLEEQTGPMPALPLSQDKEDELEYRLGQNWFAKVGIVVLTIGIGLFLTLPFDGFPPVLPAVIGFVLVAVLLVLSRLFRESFPMISGYLRGSGMALLYITALRLFFFGSVHPLAISSPEGVLVLVGVPVLNIVMAMRRGSPYLLALALTTAYATALVVGTGPLVPGILILLALFVSLHRALYGSISLFYYGMVLTYVVHCAWILNNPFLGNSPRLADPSPENVFPLLIYATAFAVAILLRKERSEEDFDEGAQAFVAGAGAYGIAAILTLRATAEFFLVSHLTMAMVFVGLAVLFWVRERSRYSTFVFAMFGYLTLSATIVKVSASPQVFVWLSLESLVVVATAVWFRSRFIVVANFLIYAVIIIGYTVGARGETGISLGFGIVALLSARILNWQQHRLELKTESMRNAYLATAFVVFPYALYHLVPLQYVSLSWIGIALLYYALNLIIRAQKYRWMGHLTLLLTVMYVLIIGIIRMEPAYRIVSFLVLAVALLAVSMVFTRLRAKKKDSSTVQHPQQGQR